ncbi:MAG: hypothetical protein GX142_01435, partial [Chloroflexi bacterium]|nr:hypothetical protein [Chloroflexota bacterium]
SRSRIPALRSVLAAWGGINQAVTHFPGESFGKWFPETFDIVLLDAPCSMESLRPTLTHPLRETTPTERLRLQDRQIQLLISGLSALKVGGELVYATCSLAPEEDEAVINHVLEQYPDIFIVEDVSDKVPFQAPGLTGFDDQSFHPSLKNALRLWPHLTGMSGFFCCRLKKTGSIPAISEVPPARDFSRTQLQPLKPALQKQLYEQVQHNFGLQLDQIIVGSQFQLFQRLESVFLIPTVYCEQFITLPFEYIGMRIGQWVGEQFQPSLEFASRFGHQFTRGKTQLNHAQVAQWVEGRDIRKPETGLTPQGQYLLVTDETGRNLGVGKLLSQRLRNLLP